MNIVHIHDGELVAKGAQKWWAELLTLDVML